MFNLKKSSRLILEEICGENIKTDRPRCAGENPPARHPAPAPRTPHPHRKPALSGFSYWTKMKTNTVKYYMK